MRRYQALMRPCRVCGEAKLMSEHEQMRAGRKGKVMNDEHPTTASRSEEWLERLRNQEEIAEEILERLARIERAVERAEGESV
jgi:hypothetical protein